jgi:signal transduction histidine kinase
MPIQHEGEVIGCLNVASHADRDVPEWARNHLAVLVPQIGSILARVRAERAFHENRALLEAIYENAPFMICLLDESGNVERMNRAMTELAGGTPPDGTHVGPGHILGCIHACAHPDGCGASAHCHTCTLRLALTETLHTGAGQQRIEFGFSVLHDGRPREMRFAASTAVVPVQNGRRILICLQDITATRQLENQFLQAQKMEAIGQLAGGVAHDFNNILGATMLHLHLLLETPGPSAETKSSLRELETETRRAATLTRQLLLFSRREVAQMRRVNLNEVVQGLLKMLRRLLGEHVETAFRPHAADAWVDADAGMLEQVVMNLCVNARDAMPKGGTIQLSTAPVVVTPEIAQETADARVGSFVRLRVQDSGTGIAPADLKRIFEPFFTTKPAGKGTGLGLATVYGIVRQHQGWIGVRSTLGIGTTFDVHLPTATLPTPQPPKSSPLAALPRGDETILVVEDDAGLLRTTSLLLRTCGYRVLEARNGREALQIWQETGSQIDLIFTDIVMPGGLSGMDLAETLHQTTPSLRILMASGYSTELINAGGRPREGIVFLSKPYIPATLALAIRKCLDD